MSPYFLCEIFARLIVPGRREVERTPLEPSNSKKAFKIPILRQSIYDFSKPVKILSKSVKSRSNDPASPASQELQGPCRSVPLQATRPLEKSDDGGKSNSVSEIGNRHSGLASIQGFGYLKRQSNLIVGALDEPSPTCSQRHSEAIGISALPLINDFFLSTTATSNGSNHEGSISLKALNCRLYNSPIPKTLYWESEFRRPSNPDNGDTKSVDSTQIDPCFCNEVNNEEPPFPIDPDHMLTLIHYNIYRAFKANKKILTPFLPPCVGGLAPIALKSSSDYTQPLYGTMQPVPNHLIPPSLQPTELQQIIVHPGWVSIFPLGRLRDNAILNLGNIAWDQLFYDLIGGLFSPQLVGDLVSNYQRAGDYDDDSHPAASGHGIIVWGDPWDIANWEVTAAFVRRWGWLIVGCPEIIEASDNWRAIRGDPPLREVVEVII